MRGADHQKRVASQQRLQGQLEGLAKAPTRPVRFSKWLENLSLKLSIWSKFCQLVQGNFYIVAKRNALDRRVRRVRCPPARPPHRQADQPIRRVDDARVVHLLPIVVLGGDGEERHHWTPE